MSKATTTSSFKRLPAAFLIVAALMILTEGLIYMNRPNLIKDYWNKFLINEHVLLALHKDYDYLILGDSIQKTGIDPAGVDDGILNLGLPGGKPMSQYILLKRYLERHVPPKAVFLYVDPEPAQDSLFVILRYFISIPEFISIWRDLTWEERRVFIMKYWASLDLRKTGLVNRGEFKGPNKQFIDEMIKSRGYMSSPTADKSIEDDYFQKHKERYQSSVSFSKNELKYLDKLVEMARSKKIMVVFIGFIVPKELHDILEASGFNRDYWIFFKYLQRRYSDEIFVKSNIMFLDNKYFSDQAHVNNEGSKIYTQYFKNLIFDPSIKRMESMARSAKGSQ